MGAKRITPKAILKIHRLYKKLGTYTAVGEKMGRSASSVSKYVQMIGVSQNIRLAVDNLINKK